jgi:hypothetical protein
MPFKGAANVALPCYRFAARAGLASKPWTARNILPQRYLSSTCTRLTAQPAQSTSPLAPLGVNAALQASTDPSLKPRSKIFDEFSLNERVAVISGGNRGLGLEMALALCEAGARAVYCLDLPAKPSDEWECTRKYVKRMEGAGRLEYISADVRDQKAMWEAAEEIGDKEGRLDVCIAAAGILKAHTDCLEYPAEQFKEAS